MMFDMVKIFLAAAIFLCLCGCVENQTMNNSLGLSGDKIRLDNTRYGDKISCSMDGGTMDDVLMLLPPDASICISENLRFSRISLDVQGVDLDTFLFAVSKSIQCRISRYGRLYVFEKTETERTKSGVSDEVSDKGYVSLFHVPFFKSSEVISAIGQGCKYINGDSYVYRGSLAESIRVREIVDALMLNLPCEYAFEIWFVSSEKIDEFSVSGDLSIDLSSVVRRGAGSVSSNEWSIVLSAVSAIKAKRDSSRNLRHLCGVFREGSDYVANIGDSIPYIKRAVQENGSIVDTDIQYVEVGTKIQIGCSGSAVGVVSLQLDLEEISGYVSSYPQKRGSTVRTDFVVSSDDRRFVGSFFVDTKTGGLLGMRDKKTEWYVFCRVLRVSPGQVINFEKKEKKS